MYGRFDDVTASEFLDIQMDLSELRLKWDNSTAQCHIIKAGFHTFGLKRIIFKNIHPVPLENCESNY